MAIEADTHGAGDVGCPPVALGTDSRVTGEKVSDGREEEVKEYGCQDTTLYPNHASYNCHRMEMKLRGSPSLEIWFQSILRLMVSGATSGLWESCC